ncbi:MAG: RNA polymerase sigma factor [Pseudomonadota bacterium]
MSGFFANNIEEAVLSGCRRGDNAAHAQLFEAFSRPVFTLALRLTGSRAVADEVVQDTFIEVITKIQQFRGDAPIGAWVRRIAVNKALAQLRSPWHKRGEPLMPDFETCDIDQSVPHDLEICLKRLGATARSVLWLHDVEGYTHKEIAAFMDKTVSFSKSQLSRAHQRLNAWATSELHEPGKKTTPRSATVTPLTGKAPAAS